MKKFGRMFIELDGALTSISDLEKEDYEELLQIWQQTIIAYTIISMRNITNNNYTKMIV